MRPDNRKPTTKTTDGYMSQSRSLSAVLPSPTTLESYEEIKPGMVDELMELIKKEQHHRHLLEKKAINSQAYTTRIGQILAFALAIIIIYSAVSFAAERLYLLSAIVAIFGFSFLVAINFLPVLVNKMRRGNGNPSAVASSSTTRSHGAQRPNNRSESSSSSNSARNTSARRRYRKY